MHDAMYYVNLVLDFFKAGFAQVNLTLALIVALYWAWRISNWGALVTTVIGAVLMHLVAVALAPVVDHNGALGIPQIQDAAFWRVVATLFLGYTVVIGVLFLVKSLILNRASGDEHEAGDNLLMAGAGGDHHGGGHDDHHGGGHDDHHGGGHDDHHGGGHDDHHGGSHGGGHDDHHGGGHGGHGHH